MTMQKSVKSQYKRAYEIHRLTSCQVELIPYEVEAELCDELTAMPQDIVNAAWVSCYEHKHKPDAFNRGAWLNSRREYDFKQGIKYIQLYGHRVAPKIDLCPDCGEEAIPLSEDYPYGLCSSCTDDMLQFYSDQAAEEETELYCPHDDKFYGHS